MDSRVGGGLVHVQNGDEEKEGRRGKWEEAEEEKVVGRWRSGARSERHHDIIEEGGMMRKKGGEEMGGGAGEAEEEEKSKEGRREGPPCRERHQESPKCSRERKAAHFPFILLDVRQGVTCHLFPFWSAFMRVHCVTPSAPQFIPFTAESDDGGSPPAGTVQSPHTLRYADSSPHRSGSPQHPPSPPHLSDSSYSVNGTTPGFPCPVFATLEEAHAYLVAYSQGVVLGLGWWAQSDATDVHLLERHKLPTERRDRWSFWFLHNILSRTCVH